jgi:uncharacterized protein with PQ loop repeat
MDNNISSNNNNNHTNTNNIKPKEFDYMGMFILLAMSLKACGQSPLIIKITQTKSAEDISLATPIMFSISFLILAILSFKKKLYIPLFIFIIGIATSVILLLQIILYEKSKNNNDNNKSGGEDGSSGSGNERDFKFPNPNLDYK